VSLYYLASYLFFTMHSTVCTVIDLFMCVCHIFLLINYYYDVFTFDEIILGIILHIACISSKE